MNDASVRTARGFQPTFFFWMTVLMAFFVFAGFGMTYWFPLANGTFRPAPPVVHLHGLVFFCWTILLVVQPYLVNSRNIAVHRSVGTFGIALATAVMFMGAIITLLGAAASRDHPGANYYHGIYLGFMAVVGFGVLFTLAIRNVRRPEIHKRLILLAMLPLLPPGVHRTYMVPLGLTSFPILPMYLTLDAMAAAIVVHEWRSTTRVSTCTMIGTGWILVQQALHYPVTHSQWFADFVYAVSGMMHYR
jgi:hypothetical protein